MQEHWNSQWISVPCSNTWPWWIKKLLNEEDCKVLQIFIFLGLLLSLMQHVSKRMKDGNKWIFFSIFGQSTKSCLQLSLFCLKFYLYFMYVCVFLSVPKPCACSWIRSPGKSPVSSKRRVTVTVDSCHHYSSQPIPLMFSHIGTEGDLCTIAVGQCSCNLDWFVTFTGLIKHWFDQ